MFFFFLKEEIAIFYPAGSIAFFAGRVAAG
jgi:hypothetical protein